MSERINDSYHHLPSRSSLPSGPVEEFTQTPGDPRVVVQPEIYIPVTELAAEVLRGSDPHSENIKGPSVRSDNSPVPFYSHNDAELTRLRSLVDRYKSREAGVREVLKSLLESIDREEVI